MPVSIYAGFAGDTDDGRFCSAGLFRMRNAGGWERLDGKFASPPEVRAIMTDPDRPGRVTIGTETGVLRSEDDGEHWQALPAPKPGLAVWSLLRHSSDKDTIYAGYEPAAIYRSRDDGASWESLPLAQSYPDVTAGPEMPKRITGIALDPAKPIEIYGSIEIGGLLRSLDDGKSWHAAIDGVYVVEDSVDLHAVIVSPAHPGEVTITTRVGSFRSYDKGEHWKKLAVPPLRDKGSYCRALAFAPGQAEKLYIGAGNDFDADKGALFVSNDNGASFQAVALPGPLKSTVFAIATNPRHPQHLYCATKNGGVFGSDDQGSTWRYMPLPLGGHVFALALG